jgi:tetratricopeptide (TPR) repeat protein
MPPHDETSWLRGPADPPSTQIDAARAQIEAARLRQQRLERRPPSGTFSAALPGYTLVRKLHRGGQGVVYLAVQESTGRNVAVKILSHGPLPGLSPTGLARFEREVQALSLLKHPNIVTIHDCGRNRDHVYLVMDFVNGRPLDAWVSAEAVSVRGALAVFVKVCDAINAAHLRGVIHRDLKPGNILVDDRGEPHVLDFGLAKLDTQDAARPVTMTEPGQFVGSLPWASPEQAEGRIQEVDIRTDVYSLGVVLYQVLTGRFPYPVSGHLPDIVRHIGHSEPVRPSTVLSEIDRELETILLKCLAKEPDRRYQSAGELARDLRRYLAGEPIEARRDSLAYVMTKRLQRYQMVATAAATILLVALGGLAASLLLWRHAENQSRLAHLHAEAAQGSAQRADREADQARAVVAFMREVLTSVEPEHQGSDVRLIEVLANASAAASERFAAHPQQEGEVRDLLGQIYNKLSMWREADAQYRAGLEIWRRCAGPDDRRALIDEMRCARQAINLSSLGEAVAALSAVIPRMVRVFGPDDPQTLQARRDLATAMVLRGRLREAEPTLLELRAHPALAHDDGAQIQLAMSLSDLAHAKRNRTPSGPEYDAAIAEEESLVREWIERSRRHHGPNSSLTLQGEGNLAEVFLARGEYREAADRCRDLLERSSGRLPECHDVRSYAMVNLANALEFLGQAQEPADLYLRRVECLRESTRPGNPALLSAMSDSLPVLERAGRGADGERIARELTTALTTYAGGHGDDMTIGPELYAACFVSMQGRLDEAASLFQASIAHEQQLTEPRDRARLHLFYAGHLTRARRFEDAERELQGAVALAGDVRKGTWDQNPNDLLQGLVALYQAWDKPERAEEYRGLFTAPSLGGK